MNRYKFLAILPALLLMFVLNSCDDDNNPLNGNRKFNIKNSVPPSSYNNVWNTINPLDSVGFKHNEMIEHIANDRANISTVNDTLMMNDAITSIQTFSSTYYNESFNLPNFNTEQENFYDGLENYENDLTGYFTDNYSADIASIMEDVVTYVTEFGDLPNSSHVDTIITNLKSLESVVHSSTFSTNDKNACFAALSVAKFSTVLWQYQFSDPNSQFNEWRDEEHIGTPPPAWISVGVATVADAAKAVKEFGSSSSSKTTLEKIGSTAFTSLAAAATAEAVVVGAIAEGAALLVTTVLSWLS